MSLNLDQFNNYFFVGIAGTGMSAIAQYLKGIGKNVSGSDRLFNQQHKMLIQEQFEKQNINCFFQDASGITPETEVVVISTAIEESNIEYQKARSLKIPILKRSELLATISSNKRTIAVGGTSGKSTTTAMIFHILQENGFSPSLMTGAGLTALQQQGLPGNAWVGGGDWLVIEADESDGSIVNYYPEISLVLNVDRDHKEFNELMLLFQAFKDHTSNRIIVNNDHPLASTLSQDKSFDFGTSEGVGFKGEDFKQQGFNIQFNINNIPFSLPVIGLHNMENAMAATAAASAAGVTIENSSRALKSYQGIYRRTQLVGEKGGIYVIDDFAHNPAEVAAAIKSCQGIGKRVFAWFQPHGYGPLRFMHEELAEKVSDSLRKNDYFLMSDIYYAGGTVAKDINSDVVTDAVKKNGKNSAFIPNRENLKDFLVQKAENGDIILLMGARDPSLSEFAVELKNGLIY